MRRRVIAAAVMGAALVVPAQAAQPGYTSIVSGTTANGGTFELSARHQEVGGSRGICVALEFTRADGFQPGAGIACLAGDLGARKGLAPVATTSRADGARVSSLVGGLVTARARKVVVRFDDGRKATVRAVRGPHGFRRELGQRVRWFGLDAMGASPSTPRTAIAYDKRGSRLTKVPVTKR